MEKPNRLKEYTPPKMKIVEVKHQGALMNYSGTVGFHDSEKEYLA
jgi:hypothetical protein